MTFIVAAIKRLFRPAARAPQLIVTRVDGDLGQPCFERRGMRAVISAQREISFGETVLDNFFHLIPLRKEAARHPCDMTAIALEQLLERNFIAGDDRRHQRVVCLLFCWMHEYLQIDAARS